MQPLELEPLELEPLEYLPLQTSRKETSPKRGVRRLCSEITMSDFNDSFHDALSVSFNTSSYCPKMSASNVPSDDSFASLPDICESPRANMERNNQSLQSLKWGNDESANSILPLVSPKRFKSLVSPKRFKSKSLPHETPHPDIQMSMATGHMSFGSYFEKCPLDTPVKPQRKLSPTREGSQNTAGSSSIRCLGSEEEEEKEISQQRQKQDMDDSLHLEDVLPSLRSTTRRNYSEPLNVSHASLTSTRWDDSISSPTTSRLLRPHYSCTSFFKLSTPGGYDTLGPLPLHNNDTPIRIPERKHSNEVLDLDESFSEDSSLTGSEWVTPPTATLRKKFVDVAEEDSCFPLRRADPGQRSKITAARSCAPISPTRHLKAFARRKMRTFANPVTPSPEGILMPRRRLSNDDSLYEEEKQLHSSKVLCHPLDENDEDALFSPKPAKEPTTWHEFQSPRSVTDMVDDIVKRTHRLELFSKVAPKSHSI